MFGGYNTMYKYIDDEGYYMYDIENNEMVKVPVDKQYSEWFMRSQHTVNTMAIPSKDPTLQNFLAKNNMHMTNFKHFIFGGEVYSPKEQMRVASDDLIIIE